jgi:SAM-dependent methyltransferase
MADSIIRAIDEITDLPYGVVAKVTFSLSKTEVKKAAVKPILLKGSQAWQCEKFVGKAVFHENIRHVELGSFLARLAEENGFCCIHIITAESVINYRLTGKGKLQRFKQEVTVKTATPVLEHDRTKNYLLAEGMPVQALVDLGVFNKDYKIVKARYNKFRQINSFLKNIESGMGKTDADKTKPFSIVEFGCGKSYLTFILYYYFAVVKEMDVRITGYDINRDIVNLCNSLAQEYGYTKLTFAEGDVSNIARSGGTADMLVTLHACDTATDHALYYAIANKVPNIFCVPCCQQELNGQLKAELKSQREYAVFMRHGLFKKRFAELLTDAIRCEVLRLAGYSVDVVEFVGEENTPKNAMLRAHYTGHRNRDDSQLKQLVEQFGVKQTLVELVN